MDALVVVATHATSTAVLRALSRACSTLRHAALRAETEATLAACMLAGKKAVTAVLRDFVRGGVPDLTERCVDEAVGAVVVYRLRHAHIASWGAYAHFWYVSTLIVASAINVDEWRAALVAKGRDADRGAVYTDVIRTVEALALRAMGPPR